MAGVKGVVMEKMRLDKWLWAARFYKTRSLAVDDIQKGRVWVNDVPVKPAKEIGPGDYISVRKGFPAVNVQVVALAQTRGPATVARTLYEETAESIAARERAAESRRLAPEPAHQFAEGRPTKRDRRLLDTIRGR